MKYLAALAITLAAAPAWAVNKCIDAAGKVTYQNEACPQQGGKIVLHNTEPATDVSPHMARFNESLARYRKLSDERIRNMKERIAACGPAAELKPAVGMSESEFLCTRSGIAGVEKVNRTTTTTGERKQYVMRDGVVGGVRYVYVDNGVVTAVQD